MKAEKPTDNCITIPSNKIYLGFLGLVSLIIGIAGIYYSVFAPDADFRVPYFVGSAVLIICSMLSFVFSSFKILLFDRKITIKNFKTVSFDIAEIEYIDWTWYNQRQGNCYINLKNGRSYSLIRRLYSKALYDVLTEYAINKSIQQRGID